MRIFHLATAADWAAARRAGRYATATRGRSLAEEGFIHASRGDQWQQARRRWFAEVAEPLVLLVVETELLSAPVVEEPAAGGGETFPHIYGAIDLDAVVRVVELDPPRPPEASDPSSPAVASPPVEPAAPIHPAAPGESFSRVYLREMFHQLLLACLAMAVTVAGSLIGLAVWPEWGPVVGALAGLAAGLALTRPIARRRARRLAPPPHR